MMTKNPYDVLGVSPNASDDEIKRAYRDLTRKYHPDANVNNPLADLAEEKFKEVQEAYDIIMRERANGGNSYGNNYGYGSSESYSYGNQSYGNQSYGNQNSSYGYGTMDPKLRAAANYINSRRYREGNQYIGSGSAEKCDVVLSEWLCECRNRKSDSGEGSRGTGSKYGTK